MPVRVEHPEIAAAVRRLQVRMVVAEHRVDAREVARERRLGDEEDGVRDRERDAGEGQTCAQREQKGTECAHEPLEAGAFAPRRSQS